MDWSQTDRYFLGVSQGGALLIADARNAHYEGSTSKLVLASLDSQTLQRVSALSVSVAPWAVGSVLFSPDGYLYVLLGQGNPTENPDMGSLVVRKYDAMLNVLGEAEVARGLYSPLFAGASMMLSGATLVGQTSTTLLGFPHHEGSVTFALDTSTMTPTRVGNTWVSHSMAQFVRAHGEDVVLVDHGDGAPRAVQIQVLRGFLDPTGPSSVDPEDCVGIPIMECFYTYLPKDRHQFFPFEGEMGENFTGTTVNGFEVAATRALTVGVSLPHDQPVRGVRGGSADMMPNAYVASTDLSSGVTALRWLTNLNPKTTRTVVGQPRIVRLSEDRFAVLFQLEKRTGSSLEYRLVNSQGDLLATRSWVDRQFSALGEPILLGSQLLWVGPFSGRGANSRSHAHYLFGLGVSDPAAPTVLPGRLTPGH